jgi:hypothetical protein
MSFFKLIDLTSFFFTPIQYASAGYGILDLYYNGYTVDNLYQCGYTIQEIYDISDLQYPNKIGIEYLKSNIPTEGPNSLTQIMNKTTYPLVPLFTYYTDPLNNHKIHEIQRLFQIYSIFDLYSIGFGISFMKYTNIPIQKVYPLVERNIIQYSFLKNGDRKNGLFNIGYTLLDIYSLNNTDTTISNIYESFGFTIKDFYDSGFTALEMQDAGISINNYITSTGSNLTLITPRTLYNAGYSLNDLYDTGYNSTDYLNSGFTVSNFILDGFSIFKIRQLFGDITISDYIIKYHASLKQVISANYTLEQIFPYRNNFTISNFLNNGFSILDLYNIGFTFSDFYTAYISSGIPTLSQILKLHYNVYEIIPFDISIPLYYDASYSSLELFNNGFIINILKDYYSLFMFKHDIIPLYLLYTSGYYTYFDFSNVGYVLIDFFNSHIPLLFVIPYYSVPELIESGFTIDQVLSTHYYSASVFYNLNYLVSIVINYYTLDELLKGGYSKRDLNIEGSNITQYCCSKKGLLYSQPSVLGSSMNQTRSSSKMNYSKNISSRIGGSYNASYSTYLTNTNIPNAPKICADSFNSTTASAAASTRCLSLNIPSKTSGAFSYFIRNYIENEIKLYNSLLENSNKKIITDAQIVNLYNEIYASQNYYPDKSIYTIIKDILFPSKNIITGPF